MRQSRECERSEVGAMRQSRECEREEVGAMRQSRECERSELGAMRQRKDSCDGVRTLRGGMQPLHVHEGPNAGAHC